MSPRFIRRAKYYANEVIEAASILLSLFVGLFIILFSKLSGRYSFWNIRVRKHLEPDFQHKHALPSLEDHQYEIAPLSAYERALSKHAETLVPLVARRLGMGRKDLSRRIHRIYARVSPEFNGITEPDEVHGWNKIHITINAGLMNTVMRFTAMLTSRLVFVDDYGDVTENSHFPFHATVKYANELLEELSGGKPCDVNAEFLLNLTPRQILFGDRVSYAAERFILAHEFGHVIINISTGTVPEMEEGSKDVEYIRSIFGELTEAKATRREHLFSTIKWLEGLPANEKSGVIRNWSEEFGADHIGLKLCLKQQAENNEAVIAFAGAVMSLIVQDMVEQYCTRKDPNWFSFHKHPPSALRSGAFGIMVRDWRDASDIYNSLTKMSDQIMSEVLK